ncbi:MAG: family 16 glycosylhydrolase [Bacteroidota bacterium]
MKINNISKLFCLTLFALTLLVGCAETTEDTPAVAEKEMQQEAQTPPELIVEAESFVDSKGDVTKEEDLVAISSSEDAWLAFDLNIPVSGRYVFSLQASSDVDSSTAWLEDYIDNKDDRTYNVTGSLPIAKTNIGQSTVDGSPLQKGLHKVRLHLKEGNIKVDKFKLRLLKEHQTTPKKMTQKTDGQEWKVVWADEFDGEGLPDTSKWTFDIGNWGWGNNELQYYTENRLENARQENGNLIIEARKNDMGQQWTSARLTTRGKVTFLYGRIEFRAKVPPQRGNWAAGWTLGDEYVDELSWPYCGEIDILESVGYEMDDETGNGKAHASVHCGAYYFKLGNQPTAVLDVENMHEAYHLYSVDWTPEGITAAVDGQEYFSYTDTSSDLAWPFGKAQNIILNLAMGGGWGGALGMDPDVETQQFLIDYVRVYAKQ